MTILLDGYEVKKKMNKTKKFNTSFLFVLPYAIIFFLLIVLPILIAIFLSFTYYNSVQAPTFIGITNYINMFTSDTDFLQYAIPNTVKYALIIGPVGYALAFFLAWVLAQIPHKLRTVLAIVLYSPSLTGAVMMGVVWKVIFSGDSTGYLNYFLMNLGVIDTSVQWLQDKSIIFGIMIFTGLWQSMGVGFLAMLSGILNINQELYEAAYVDGLKTRWQEIFYITIPSMRPQMLFGAVMALVGTFNAYGMAVSLSGSTPPPQFAGWLIVDHMYDYGFARFEMGYASALSVILLLIVLYTNSLASKVLGEKE